MLVKSNDDLKYSRSIETNQYFCYRTTYEKRTDFARVASDKCHVLELNCKQHAEILACTKMTES